ncbi:hypothetical protein METBIDRAFT_199876 [Metschnikowia bicuspidata var. bicuspidata NRRL YB-4993]|uniref:Uncharacterized protein n=1 Tax=Metschnikowia bicuspidata var. bicuspidata NRRL YB-4993 TaxID=869754 RepID=A0A1A0H926_9ASCO|nr:hypothetical protein METBIDRAFT_199876 [Metschnikowia bicuspidata var. bicuspidata NRRL YB-4993]OBA20505.1 hypothetical protein METBIDRAFT_199876 [Metschnikowia bicuspidata var. bicuspidata NRRL YB-4993]
MSIDTRGGARPVWAKVRQTKGRQKAGKWQANGRNMAQIWQKCQDYGKSTAGADMPLHNGDGWDNAGFCWSSQISSRHSATEPRKPQAGPAENLTAAYRPSSPGSVYRPPLVSSAGTRAGHVAVCLSGPATLGQRHWQATATKVEMVHVFNKRGHGHNVCILLPLPAGSHRCVTAPFQILASDSSAPIGPPSTASVGAVHVLEFGAPDFIWDHAAVRRI